jgi:propanol-preferring alcohol dehydrogenase
MVVDISDEKLVLAQHSGADEVHRSDQISVQDKQQTKSLRARATIVASGSSAAYEMALPLTASHGHTIAIGVSPQRVPVNLLEMVTRDLSLVATNQGSRQELAECLEIAATAGLKPEVEIRQLDELEEGFRELMEGNVSGRLVYRLWK